MKTSLLIFPHQLYLDHPGFGQELDEVVLIEDSLFFGDQRYPLRFHQQKLWLHRASMQRYAAGLRERDFRVRYASFDADTDPLHEALHSVQKRGVKQVLVADPTDFILEKRLRHRTEQHGLQLDWLENPGFLNTREENRNYRVQKNRWQMADFYKYQRQRLKILMDGKEPLGGQWSFDQENRKKVPKKRLDALPSLPVFQADEFDSRAREHVERFFGGNPGQLERLYYPTSHEAAEAWLQTFLTQRLECFGDYEDAIVEGESWLWHGVLTPMLNIGLLTPKQIIDATLAHADQNKVPMNSLEGFIRQIVGWREFMRATYEDLGLEMRTTNHWNHQRSIPDCFYDASTGIDPLDDVIERVIQTGYCHHIERLMVLGGFMFLCEFDPHQVYRWFMELFVDAYDWVMVPNVYAMSQHADGGLITTKPYFSGSAYIKKMSHHKHGDWADIWDGLYWRWIWNHRKELAQNPRWAMMCAMAEKMDVSKRRAHLKRAEAFLAKR